MPKVKTRKGVAKRFRLTATGKIKRKHAYMRHILGGKKKNRKRHLRKSVLVDGTQVKQIAMMLHG
jgi:large subunit ribosomal protein L35